MPAPPVPGVRIADTKVPSQTAPTAGEGAKVPAIGDVDTVIVAVMLQLLVLV